MVSHTVYSQYVIWNWDTTIVCQLWASWQPSWSSQIWNEVWNMPLDSFCVSLGQQQADFFLYKINYTCHQHLLTWHILYKLPSCTATLYIVVPNLFLLVRQKKFGTLYLWPLDSWGCSLSIGLCLVKLKTNSEHFSPPEEVQRLSLYITPLIISQPH